MLTAMFRLAPGQSVDAATAALRARQPDILGLSGASPRQLPAMLKDPYVLVPGGVRHLRSIRPAARPTPGRC